MIPTTVYRIISVIMTVKVSGFAVGATETYLQEQEVKTTAEMNCCPALSASLCASSSALVINDLPHKSHQCIMREQELLERHECDVIFWSCIVSFGLTAGLSSAFGLANTKTRSHYLFTLDALRRRYPIHSLAHWPQWWSERSLVCLLYFVSRQRDSAGVKSDITKPTWAASRQQMNLPSWLQDKPTSLFFTFSSSLFSFLQLYKLQSTERPRSSHHKIT